MRLTHKISQTLFDKEQDDLGKHARDVQEIFNRIPVVVHKVVDSPYAEPMAIGGSEEEPFSIELVRLVNLSAPLQYVAGANGLVHFTWLPRNGGIVIDNIGGMTVGTAPQPKLRFYFRITYRME